MEMMKRDVKGEKDEKNKGMRKGRIGNKDRRVEGYKGVVYYTLYDKPKQRSTINEKMGQGDNETMS